MEQTSYVQFMLTLVTLKERKETEKALSKIETSGLPNHLIEELRYFFINSAGNQKTLNGVFAIINCAMRIIVNSGVSDEIYSDFKAKASNYIEAIVNDEEGAQAAIDFRDIHRL